MPTIVGTNGPETLNGTDQDDEIFGRGGDDVINGLGGNDALYWSSGDGFDRINGGAGVDTAFALASDIVGISEHFSIFRHDVTGRAIFSRGSGSFGDGFRDVLEMEQMENFSLRIDNAMGRPSISVRNLTGTGLTGTIQIQLTDQTYQDFRVDGSTSVNRLVVLGNVDDDFLHGGSAGDDLYGFDGNDTLDGGGGVNTLIGGSGDDFYISNSRDDTVVELAGEGIDTLQASYSNPVLLPNFENLFYEGSEDFTGVGNDVANFLKGGNGGDYLIGLGGNDILYGRGGSADTLQGGLGDDLYITEKTSDTLFEVAGEGHDRVETTLTAFALSPNIEDLFYFGFLPFSGIGNAVDNYIRAGPGHDLLNGRLGNDRLEGLLGSDYYVFDSALGPNNVDTIVGFAGGSDRVLLDDAIFTTLSPGSLPEDAFIAASAAQDAEDRIVFDSATGALYYDADGNGAGAAVLFANVGAGANLNYSDFAVI